MNCQPDRVYHVRDHHMLVDYTVHINGDEFNTIAMTVRYGINATDSVARSTNYPSKFGMSRYEMLKRIHGHLKLYPVLAIPTII